MKEIIYAFSKHNAKNAQHVLFVQDVLAAVPEATATTYGFGKQRRQATRWLASSRTRGIWTHRK